MHATRSKEHDPRRKGQNRRWSLTFMFGLTTFACVFAMLLRIFLDLTPTLNRENHWRAVRNVLTHHPHYLVQFDKDFRRDRHVTATNVSVNELPRNDGDPHFDSVVSAIIVPESSQVGDRELTEIGEIETLQVVWIYFDQTPEFGVEGIASLAQLPRLKWLCLAGDVPPALLAPLRNCRSLQKLSMFRCSAKRDVATELLRALPNLLEVEVGGDTFLRSKVN